ncbi:hypothetical protein J437_LFUL006304 [Ladona fulva]|uniref:Pro-resilin n=1 Tax=Ladona fulva TaxID=123851 RepID=A0A8K0P020_LADFU|nr:hypothetical protein J437_LFUL006304 [Ladona fulva]
MRMKQEARESGARRRKETENRLRTGFQSQAYSKLLTTEWNINEPANYNFQYQVNDEEAGANFGHEEQREGEDAKGEYRVLLPDGRTLVVAYTADERGFIPEIRYEEPQGGYGRGPQKGY